MSIASAVSMVVCFISGVWAMSSHASGAMSGSAEHPAASVVSTPVITPSGGTYTASITATISDTTAAATIYYTTNGSTPTTGSTRYTGKITVAKSETLKAIAVAPGDTSSTVASAIYSIVAKPAAPAGVAAVAGTDDVSITWKSVSGASSYKVYRSTSAGSRGQNIRSTLLTSYTDTSPVPGTTYYYEVTAVNSAGEGPASTQTKGVSVEALSKPTADMQAFAVTYVALQAAVSLSDIGGMAAGVIACNVGGAVHVNSTTHVVTLAGCESKFMPGNAYSGTLSFTAYDPAFALDGMNVAASASLPALSDGKISFEAPNTGFAFVGDLIGSTYTAAESGIPAITFGLGTQSTYVNSNLDVTDMTRTISGAVVTTTIAAGGAQGNTVYNENPTLVWTNVEGAITWIGNEPPKSGTIVSIGANGTVELTIEFLSSSRFTLFDPLTGLPTTIKNWSDADVQNALKYVTR